LLSVSRSTSSSASGRATITTSTSSPVNRRIAEELGVRENQVSAAVDLLDGGATVPFIARYRKEVTGTLDDTQLRTLEERLRYLRELEERRVAVLESVQSQGKLDDALMALIMAAETEGYEQAQDDAGPVLHEEVNRLPEKYRAPVVLCYLEE